jgi:hypothetical protein
MLKRECFSRLLYYGMLVRGVVIADRRSISSLGMSRSSVSTISRQFALYAQDVMFEVNRRQAMKIAFVVMEWRSPP